MKSSKSIVRLNFHGLKVEAIFDPEFDLKTISSWKDNLRTILNLKVLSARLKKDVKDINDSEILTELRKDRLIHLSDLSEDIRKYGINNPIILYNNILLDGNRRFFASLLARLKITNDQLISPEQLNAKQKNEYNNVTYAPCYIIQTKLDTKKIQKIISSLNFVSTFKEPWPREVRFEFIKNYYSENKNSKDIYEEIKDIYNFTRSDIAHVIKVLKFTEEFRKWRAKNISRFERPNVNYKEETEKFIRDKFIIFEEFYNKLAKGTKSILNKGDQIEKAKIALFELISSKDGVISGIPDTRVLIEISRNPKALTLLEKGNFNAIAFEKARILIERVKLSEQTEFDHYQEFLDFLEVESDAALSKLNIETIKKIIVKLSNLLKGQI